MTQSRRYERCLPVARDLLRHSIGHTHRCKWTGRSSLAWNISHALLRTWAASTPLQITQSMWRRLSSAGWSWERFAWHLWCDSAVTLLDAIIVLTHLSKCTLMSVCRDEQANQIRTWAAGTCAWLGMLSSNIRFTCRPMLQVSRVTERHGLSRLEPSREIVLGKGRSVSPQTRLPWW